MASPYFWGAADRLGHSRRESTRHEAVVGDLPADSRTEASVRVMRLGASSATTQANLAAVNCSAEYQTIWQIVWLSASSP